MNAEDDPERRIRELEQPLSDAARASELGGTQPAGGYNYQSPWAGAPIPPPPPPGSYGGPLMSPRPPSGNRAWWILGALFVIGVLALVGGIAAFAAHQFSRGGSVVLSTPPSISRTTTAPRTSPKPNAEQSRAIDATPRRQPHRRGHQRESDDRMQRQHGRRQRGLEHGRDHRPLHKPHGVRRAERDHGRCRRHHRRLRLQQQDHLSHGLAEDQQVRRRERRAAGLTGR